MFGSSRSTQKRELIESPRDGRTISIPVEGPHSDPFRHGRDADEDCGRASKRAKITHSSPIRHTGPEYVDLAEFDRDDEPPKDIGRAGASADPEVQKWRSQAHRVGEQRRSPTRAIGRPKNLTGRLPSARPVLTLQNSVEEIEPPQETRPSRIGRDTFQRSLPKAARQPSPPSPFTYRPKVQRSTPAFDLRRAHHIVDRRDRGTEAVKSRYFTGESRCPTRLRDRMQPSIYPEKTQQTAPKKMRRQSSADELSGPKTVSHPQHEGPKTAKLVTSKVTNLLSISNDVPKAANGDADESVEHISDSEPEAPHRAATAWTKMLQAKNTESRARRRESEADLEDDRRHGRLRRPNKVGQQSFVPLPSERSSKKTSIIIDLPEENAPALPSRPNAAQRLPLPNTNRKWDHRGNERAHDEAKEVISDQEKPFARIPGGKIRALAKKHLRNGEDRRPSDSTVDDTVDNEARQETYDTTARESSDPKAESPGVEDRALTPEDGSKIDELDTLPPKWDEALTWPWEGVKRVTVEYEDLYRLNRDEFLNDSLVSFSLRRLELQASESAGSIYFFNTYFYDTLVKLPSGRAGFNYDAVKRWTRKVDLFSYDHVIIPVNRNFHWYLFIVSNIPAMLKFGQDDEAEMPSTPEQEQFSVAEIAAKTPDLDLGNLSLEAHATDSAPPSSALDSSQPASSLPDPTVDKAVRETKSRPKRDRWRGVYPSRAPIVIALDSMGGEHTTEIRHIKQYFVKEAAERKGVTFTTRDINGTTAKGIPTQTNASDCGIFLIAYVAEFMENPRKFVKKVCSREMDETNSFKNFDPSIARALIRTDLISLELEQREQMADNAASSSAMDGDSAEIVMNSPLLVKAQTRDGEAVKNKKPSFVEVVNSQPEESDAAQPNTCKNSDAARGPTSAETVDKDKEDTQASVEIFEGSTESAKG